MSPRALYIDDWHQIYTNPAKLTELGGFCQDKGIDEVALYRIKCALNSPANFSDHAAAVTILHNYGIASVRVAFGSKEEMDRIFCFQNSTYANATTSFAGMILEYEWWNTGGSFNKAMTLLERARYEGGIGSGITYPMKISAYVGWLRHGNKIPMSNQEITDLCSYLDEIDFHAYVTDANNAFLYTEERLNQVAGFQKDYYPIFSAEDTFMGPWIWNNGMASAEALYQVDFNNWLVNTIPQPAISLKGFMYYTYPVLKQYLPA